MNTYRWGRLLFRAGWDHGPGAGLYWGGVGGFGVGYDTRPLSPDAPTYTDGPYGWVRTWRALGFSFSVGGSR